MLSWCIKSACFHLWRLYRKRKQHIEESSLQGRVEMNEGPKYAVQSLLSAERESRKPFLTGPSSPAIRPSHPHISQFCLIHCSHPPCCTVTSSCLGSCQGLTDPFCSSPSAAFSTGSGGDLFGLTIVPLAASRSMNGYCVIKANMIMSLLQILLQFPNALRIKSEMQLPLGPLPHSHF